MSSFNVVILMAVDAVDEDEATEIALDSIRSNPSIDNVDIENVEEME